MEAVFARYLEAGIFGSIIILLILLLRLCLRKAPRRVLCLLWLVAAVRLLLPFKLESRLSLQPDLEQAAQLVQEQAQYQQPEYVPPADIRIPAQDEQMQPVTTPVTDPAPEDIKTPVSPMRVLCIVWMSVAGAAMVYLLVSYLLLKLRVREAVRCEDGVMECDRIRGAFLLGYFRPRIYLPFHVQQRDRQFIIAHERAHIARGDNWWKLLGFVCAAIHWYNPLVWLAYALLCRDIELACDERVIRQLDLSERKAYSMALLNCGKSLAGVSVCPVAFGETSLKTRIKSVLHYRKPALWITVVAFVLIAVTAVCFLTSPMAEALPPEEIPEETQEQTEEPTQPPTEPPETEPVPEITEHVHAYTLQTVAPTCTEEGYDLHFCTCGDQYTDNPTEKIKHEYYWVEVRYSENKMRAQCAHCPAEFWQTVPLDYNDTGSATERLKSYAAAYGFNMDFVGDKSDAKYFSYCADISEKDDDTVTAAGKLKITEAYDYCIANNLDVAKQMCYIEVTYSGTGYGLPDTPLTSGTGVSYPSVSIDNPNTSQSNQSFFGSHTYSGSSNLKTKITRFRVYVYIAPMPVEEAEENQQNAPTDSVVDASANTGSTDLSDAAESTESANLTEPTDTTEPTEDSVQDASQEDDQTDTSEAVENETSLPWD